MAGEAAAAYSPETEVDRTEAARNRADAERLRQAEADGLVISEIPLAEIDPDDMVRDRARVDEEDLRELRDSILKNGLRLPIEVYELAEPRDGRRYGVLSGYRRLLAMQQIYDYTELPRYGAIRALVRTPASVPDAFVAMVEENEIRASLSAYERGRIAVVATQSGAFNGVEAAVDALFATASKAKRSKVRSFAAIFEDLGDLLRFPEALTERQGLRLASALRAGHHEALRDLLDERRAATPEEEWETVQPIIDEVEQGPRPVRRGGRPRSAGRAKP
ncbi:MAG: ParB N-terminal domain-containing protein, partial [Pseudomonadota bacterium]